MGSIFPSELRALPGIYELRKCGPDQVYSLSIAALSLLHTEEVPDHVRFEKRQDNNLQLIELRGRS